MHELGHVQAQVVYSGVCTHSQLPFGSVYQQLSPVYVNYACSTALAAGQLAARLTPALQAVAALNCCSVANRFPDLAAAVPAVTLQALRPITALLQPLQMQLWRDTHPTARDLATALTAASRAASAIAAARVQLLQGLPAAPAATAAAPAAGPALGREAAAAAAVQQQQAEGGVAVTVHVLNRFCYDTTTQPHAAEAAALAATAALPPGTDMTPEDVAAAKAAAEQAALAAAQHAQLLSTLPLWLVPGETSSCNEALKHAATLLPMPAYGLTLHRPEAAAAAAATAGPSSSAAAEDAAKQRAAAMLAVLTEQCVQPLLQLQATGPYVIVGCGVFSCMLAAAMACELEHQLQQQVVLVLLDGPPVVPTAVQLPEPVVHGLYQLARDSGTLPALAADGSVPQPFAGFAAELSAQLQAGMAAAGSAVQLSGTVLPPAAEPDVPALEAAVQQVAAARFVGPGRVTPGAIDDMLRCCRVGRQIWAAYAPDYVYQGPAVMVLTEDAEGRAFLEACRESCGGELSLVPLAGLGHGQVLTGEREQQVVLVALVDGLMEMLQML